MTLRIKPITALMGCVYMFFSYPIQAQIFELDPTIKQSTSRNYQHSNLLEQARRAFENNDFGLSFHLAKQASSNGEVDAHFLLALLYMQGIGTLQNKPLGLGLLKQAAEQGNLDAQGAVALREISLDINDEQQTHLLSYAKHSYESGSIIGKAAMAFAIHDGYAGIEPDEEKGQQLLLEAMETPESSLNFFEKMYLPFIQSIVLSAE